MIYKGSKQLASLAEGKTKPDYKHWWFWTYLLVAAFYLYETLSSPDKNTAATATIHGLFYLPNLLLIITLLLPYIVAWYLAIRGSIFLAYYYKNTKGAIYKSALHSLSLGLMIVVGVTILIQFLTILADRHNTDLAKASLNTVLAMIYLLLVVISIGFLVIARGAKKLKLIEEV